jgi:hypothetical protein
MDIKKECSEVQHKEGKQGNVVMKEGFQYQCCGAYHLVEAGAGAVTRCGSGSDGSGSDNGIKHG